MDKCETCINKTEISEAELYCMSEYYGYGQIFDWCSANNVSLDYMEYLGCDFNNCDKYKNNNINKGEL